MCKNVFIYLKKEVKDIKAGLYARVSTDIQVEGYSIDSQKELLINFAKVKEYDEYEFYIDGGYSGKDLERPEIQRLIQDVKNNKLDCVMVFKLDRISRCQRDTLFLIEEVFNKYNVGFVSIRENFDTTSPFGKAMIGVLSVFAQLERETILERTRLGIEKRAEAGLWRGGGKIPYAYDYDKDKGTLIPNEERVEVLDKMISMYLSGKSFIKIGNVVGMDESLVEKRILSITNTGVVPYKDKVFDGLHDAVVSDETYQKILETNKLRSKARTERHYLLSGKIFCGHCGAKYRYQKWGKRLICYCYSQQKSKPKFIKDPNCKNKRIDSFEIEDALLESLFSFVLDEELFKETFALTKVSVVEEMQIRLSKTSKQIENLISFISDGIAVLETKEKIIKLQTESEQLEIELSLAKDNEERNKVTHNILKNLKSTWYLMEFEEKRLIIQHIVDKIIVNNNELSIHYKIA